MMMPTNRLVAVLATACVLLFVSTLATSVDEEAPTHDARTYGLGLRLRFDHIIAGGGASGAALAGKLARAGKQVLLLEAGENTQYDPSIAQTMGFFGGFNTWSANTGLSSDTSLIWPNTVVGDSGRFGQKSPPGSGKGLGGGTSIFMMNCIYGGKYMYDYADNGWPASWNYASMKPYYAQLKSDIAPNRETKKPPATQAFLKALRVQADEQYAAGGMDYLVNLDTYANGPNVENPNPLAPQLDHNDINGVNSVVGFSQFQFFINKLANGTYIRKAPANTYLGPDCLRLDGEGVWPTCRRLTVLTGAYVSRVIFDVPRRPGARPVAVGVEFHHDGEVKTATARKEVIVSAGSYQTPAILQRSGYGPADYLEHLGIDVVYNNTQVGKHLINHFSSLMAVKVVGSQEAVNAFMVDAPAMGGNMGFNGGAMLTYHKNHPNKPVEQVSVRKTQFMLYTSGNIFPGHVGALYGVTRKNETLTFALDDMRFAGTGYVQISGKNPFDFPEVYFNTFVDFTNPKGLTGQAYWDAARVATDALISSILMYNIGHRTAVRMNETLAAECNSARLQIAFPTLSYLETLEQGIQAFGDDWWKYLYPAKIITATSTQLEKDLASALANLVVEIRAFGAYVDSHQCGTSKIGTVVDDKLSVIGVDNLRVVDASVMPGPSGGNTAATAIAIALRAAAEILADSDDGWW